MISLRKKVVHGRTYWQAWENGRMVKHLGSAGNVVIAFIHFEVCDPVSGPSAGASGRFNLAEKIKQDKKFWDK